MSRLRWPLLVFLCCLPVAILALGIPIPGLTRAPTGPVPMDVPTGDIEMAWLHTTTNGATWERFVAGMQRATELVPGLEVDESHAFPDRTHDVPEVVLARSGFPGKLRIRWYKIGADATTTQWVHAFAKRKTAPVALIGGGSSDRAKELAKVMKLQTNWAGLRPMLFLTTATADEVEAGPDAPAGQSHVNLVDLYDERTFRFCFTNKQMAQAVLDFVWATSDLLPEMLEAPAQTAVASGLVPATAHPAIYTIVWQDDPYSTDLSFQFRDAIRQRSGPTPHFFRADLPFSIGRFSKPNRAEAEAAQLVLADLRSLPPQRALLVLPTVAPPARRILGSLFDSDPEIARRLVAVNGDGIAMNVIYRDGEFAWPIDSLPIPMAFFAHHDPVRWDQPKDVLNRPLLLPPTSTEDVLHFAELTRVVAEATFHKDGIADNADLLHDRLHQLAPKFFDRDGNRVGGTGEYVLVLRPKPGDVATLEIWKRAGGTAWAKIRTVTVPPPSSILGGIP